MTGKKLEANPRNHSCDLCVNSFKFSENDDSVYCNKDGKFHAAKKKRLCKSFESKNKKFNL